jgi:hypothetical protein
MAPYEKEQKIFKDQYAVNVDDDAAKIIIDKIVRHFKLQIGEVRFYGGHQGGMAYQHESKGLLFARWSNIRLGHNPSYGLICHELAHALEHKKGKVNRHGSKGFLRNMQRIINYGVKKNWWADEIAKRTAPKLPGPEPTKNALRMDKIEKAKQNIKRYESKIKFFTNKLKKAKKSLNALERFLNKEIDKDIEDEILNDSSENTN